MSRIFANIFLFLSILYFPWWVTALFAVAASLIFKNFYEVIFWGFAMDFLYGTREALFYGFGFFTALGALFLFIVVHSLKTWTRLSQ